MSDRFFEGGDWMLSFWLTVWLIGASLVTVPAVLFTWGFIELTVPMLLLTLMGMIVWIGAVGNAYRLFNQQQLGAIALPNALVMRVLPLLAAMGVWLSALAFAFPIQANLIVLLVLFMGGQLAFLSLLFHLREIEHGNTRGRSTEFARA